ncbi:MAG: transcription elongation factor, GreA/GreB family [Fibrobacteres bacterium]|nr:transcription elongation factor, GreA/GreB family [Fibrobacterota bacterium]
MTPSRPISPDGMENLKQEWEHLWREVRPKLLEEIAAAAAQGDRSENAEYIYGKRKLREIDRRLRQLDEKISHSTVVGGASGGGGRETGKIVFGARVRLRRGDGREMLVQIVGVDEINPVEGRISMDSPIGKSLMGMPPTGRVEVQTPKGPVAYDIIEVDYP